MKISLINFIFHFFLFLHVVRAESPAGDNRRDDAETPQSLSSHNHVNIPGEPLLLRAVRNPINSDTKASRGILYFGDEDAVHGGTRGGSGSSGGDGGGIVDSNKSIPVYQRLLQGEGGAGTEGLEIGETCSMDSECFTGHCIEGTCQCLSDSDCYGCTMGTDLCLRLEQPHWDQPLQICQMTAERFPSQDESDTEVIITRHRHLNNGNGNGNGCPESGGAAALECQVSFPDGPPVQCGGCFYHSACAAAVASYDPEEDCHEVSGSVPGHLFHTATPSVTPSDVPSVSPSETPSAIPSSSPSSEPSLSSAPSAMPSSTPSGQPSGTPSVSPSAAPSWMPSSSPSAEPSLSAAPSVIPSASPSAQPSSAPSVSSMPSSMPSVDPTWTLKSLGGGHTESYGKIRFLANSNRGNELDVCDVLYPYDSDKNLLPPAFLQGNVMVDQVEDIKGIRFYAESPESLIDSFVFLSGNWIKTLTLDDWTEQEGLKYMDIQPWDRVNAVDWDHAIELLADSSGQSIVVVVVVAGEKILDFDIPPYVGVEFLPENEDAILVVDGSIQLQGRASFKDLTISFRNGTMDVGSSTIFQHCNLIDLQRCPNTFEEDSASGMCLAESGIPDRVSDANEYCDSFDGAFWPTVDDVAGIDISKFVSAKVWIQRSDPNADCSGVLIDPWGQLTEPDDCQEEIHPIICMAAIKEGIISSSGVTYASYFSNHELPSYEQASSRLVDESRLPLQLGATISFPQDDVLDEQGNPITFVVGDTRPVAFKVAVSLKEGSTSSISVATDTFDSPMLGSDPIFFEWDVTETTVLPTRVQLHLGAADPVCVDEVSIILRNQTGAEHIVASIPAQMFADCMDTNVCDASTEDQCPRSLAYYDSSQECLRLEVGNPKVPRDLSLRLFDISCSRLTSWNHPLLGEPIRFEVETTAAPSDDDPTRPEEDLLIEEKGSFTNKFRISSPGTFSVSLQEATLLPMRFTVTEGAHMYLKSIKIVRCKSVCRPVRSCF